MLHGIKTLSRKRSMTAMSTSVSALSRMSTAIAGAGFGPALACTKKIRMLIDIDHIKEVCPD